MVLEVPNRGIGVLGRHMKPFKAPKAKGWQGLRNAVVNDALTLGSVLLAPLDAMSDVGAMAVGDKPINENRITEAMLDVGMLNAPVGLLGGVPKGAVLGANVWQGGPHKYGPEGASQSLKHMGKGEGAQAYGWGRYDAESRGVAEDYKRQLSRDAIEIDGRRIENDTGDGYYDKATETLYGRNSGPGIATEVLKQHKGDQRKALRTLKRDSDELLSYENLSEIDEDKLSALDEAMGLIEKGRLKLDEGHLYKHDLPDEDIARYLDWDAPLSEQPESVMKAAQSFTESKDLFKTRKLDNGKIEIIAPDGGGMGHYLPDEVDGAMKDLVGGYMRGVGGEPFTGGQFYERMMRAIGKQEASEALGRAGIPGLKYYDGMSRNAKDGTRNYVTWDQGVLNRMKLLERNGVNMLKVPE